MASSEQRSRCVLSFSRGDFKRLKLKKVERQRQQSDERMRGNSDRTRRKLINRKLMIFLLRKSFLFCLFSRNFVVSSEPEKRCRTWVKMNEVKNTFNHLNKECENEFVEMMLFNCVCELKEMDEKSIPVS